MKTCDSKYCGCLYFASNALARKIEKLALESWKEVNLSPSHAYVLMMVNEEPGVQPGCLSNHLHLQPSTITRLIEKLEEKKLVIRTTEGKTTNVYPTPKGKELYPKLKECSKQFNDNYCSILGKEESHKLITSMNKISDKIDS